MNNKVLTGVRVLDFARYLAGPYCAMLLADMGAEVIRVEEPGGSADRTLGPLAPTGDSMSIMTVNRNKKGITLDLTKEKGREVMRELVKRSDMVVENYGAGTKEPLGLGYESLKKVNPAIILVSISGFGGSGPYSKRLAFDPTAQALSSSMSYTGFPGGPPTRGAAPYVDFSTGIYSALGAMLALYHREKTGVGQVVDMALLDTAVSFSAGYGVAAEYKILGTVRQPLGNHSFYNYSDSYQAKDGWVMISVIGHRLWKRFARLIGKEEWGDDARFKDDNSRFEHRDIIRSVVSRWMATRTVAEVIKALEENRVPCAKVNNAADMFVDPQIRARGMIVDVDYPGVGPVPLGGVTIKLSETPGSIETRSPLVGEHNQEVYGGLLGYSPKELAALAEEGVI